MANLASKETNAAWVDFRNYLIDCGFLLPEGDKRGYAPDNREKMRVAKMAFKQGFVTGAAFQNQAEQFGSVRVEKVKKREYKGRITRPQEQRQKDNNIIESYLRRYAGRSVPLQEITRHMCIDMQRHHWNTNNATGFVKAAIKDGRNIESAERGFYRYKG
jgi:hypothetical protein